MSNDNDFKLELFTYFLNPEECKNKQDIENKINAIFQNNAKPEDFIHLMEPPAIDYDNDEKEDITEPTTSENISAPSTEGTLTTTSQTTKEIIVEEEDDTTKHIFRRKVFTKQ